jgi:hypothetical protein
MQLPGVTEFVGEPLDGAIFDVFTVNDGVITRIDEFKTKDDARAFARRTAAPAQPGQSQRAPDAPSRRRPRVERLVPILNVSDIRDSFAWFAKLGWRKGFEWTAMTRTTAVGSGQSRPSTTSTPSTNAASPKASISPTRRQRSHGAFANATSGTRTVTCSGSAASSDQRSVASLRRRLGRNCD